MPRTMHQNVMMLVKRAFDTVFSVVLLIVLFPLLLLVSTIIRIDSKGPVLFRQKRIGLDGKEFLIAKFRTMVVDAEHLGEGKRVSNEQDLRITKFGKILRRSSLDELPQLLNVVKGDMSLIGPRPPLVYFPYKGYLSYPPRFRKRFLLRPGITGLAQIKVRNTSSWPTRMEYDIEYVDNVSLCLDISIALQTAGSLFIRKGIYPD